MFTSEADGLAVGTFFRSSEITVVELENQLPPPKLYSQSVAPDRPMAAGFQFVDYRSRHIGLELDVHLVVKPPARRIRSRLGILLVVGKPDYHLRVSLRLDRAAHHAETHHRPSLLRDERRDDRVKRPLARRDDVGMTGPQHEAVAPVLHADAVDHDAGSETLVVGLDVGNHHARSVRGGEIDGAARSGHAILRRL